MNEFLSERKSLIPLITVIFFLLLGIVYMYWVKPIKDEAKTAVQRMEDLETTIEDLEAQLTAPDDSVIEDSKVFQLSKKLPPERQVDELILSLQEIEIVSESRIEHVFFNHYDGDLSEIESILTEEQMDEEEEFTEDVMADEEEMMTENEDPSVDEGYTEEFPISEIAESLPDNIRLITFQLQVSSPNFEKSQTFLREIEQLERIIRIEALSFQIPGEQELLESELDELPVQMDVTLTTFYYPKL